MPTASSARRRSASTQPTAPQYGPRGTVSSASISGRRAGLGRAGHRPGREGRGEQVGPAQAAAQPAPDGRDEVHQPGVLLDGEQRGHRRPSPWPPPVRGRCAPGRRSSRSRRGPCRAGPSAVRAGALDRARGSTVSPSRRRKSSGDADTTSTPCVGQRARPRVRRRVAAGEQPGEAAQVGGRRQRRGQHPAEVGLVDVPGGDPRADALARPLDVLLASSSTTSTPRGAQTVPPAPAAGRPVGRRSKRAQTTRPS